MVSVGCGSIYVQEVVCGKLASRGKETAWKALPVQVLASLGPCGFYPFWKH